MLLWLPVGGSQFVIWVVLLQFSVRMAAESESLMTSVERLQEYAHLPPENNPLTVGRGVPVGVEFIAGMTTEVESKGDEAEMREPIEPATPSIPTHVTASWPHGCDVVVKGLTANHFSSPERNVLQNLHFRIKPGQRVAVVGRTGAGKSSMLSAMFRLLNIPAGSVKIGGIDISALDVFFLRSRLGIIPQVPTLFHGTLRYNLDPFNKFTDEEMLVALRKVSMENIHLDLSSKSRHKLAQVDTHISPLDMNVGEGGGNLSVGQKQLLCAARALLANPAILFMDEATANIDNETDEKIQSILRKQAAQTGMMVITIAHRLNTIMDYDLVLVLSAGRLVEFGNPVELAKYTNSSSADSGASLCHCTTGDPQNDAYFQTDVRDLSEVGLFAQMVRNMENNS